MTQQHPITPPPELVQQWAREIYDKTSCGYERDEHIATRAAQWGADQELEACCADILEILAGIFADRVIDDWEHFVELLREGRRPSLKEQALDALESLQRLTTDPNILEPLRRALEQLDD
jgi:hypothetical protein